MMVGIMQPYFFPYIGYFNLINCCDRWVVFDLINYAPRSWMNRNRILHPKSGWQYITVPVHRSSESKIIKDVRVVDMKVACRRILGQLDHYRQSRAPFFDEVAKLVFQAFESSESDLLIDLNVSAMVIVCRYIGINLDFVILSRSNVILPLIRHPGQWALEISAALNATDYLNPIGGRSLFRSEEFRARGIRLHFAERIDVNYHCGRYRFVPDLSILDMLMWNAPEAVKALLDREKANARFAHPLENL